MQCEVLEVVPLSRLVYSWKWRRRRLARQDVTWTYSRRARARGVHWSHAGFRSPQNDVGYGAMSSGWQRIVGKINEIAAAL